MQAIRVPANLANFFATIRNHLAAAPNAHQTVPRFNSAVHRLLTRQITVQAFVTIVQNITSLLLPPLLTAQIQDALARCEYPRGPIE